MNEGWENTVWMFWLGGELTPNRNQSIQQWRSLDLKINLLTEEGVAELARRGEIVLHPAYSHLSANHKSDYLRSQFMFRFGGLYSDVKPPPDGIVEALAAFGKSKSAIAGYREARRRDIPGSCSAWVRFNWWRLAGNGHFAFVPETRFAGDWIERVFSTLDKHLDSLRGFQLPDDGLGPDPSKPGWQGYPLRWAEIQGELFQPLQAKWGFPAELSLPYPILNNYR